MHDSPPQSTQADLRPVVRDGVAHATMLGFGENYLGAFAIALQGTPLQIGTLAALPPLLGALFQTASVRVIEVLHYRRRIIVIGALLQALLWIPIGSLPYTVSNSPRAVDILITLVSLYFICSGFIAPIWSSLVGDLVPSDARGRFFGRRNTFIGLATFLSMCAGGSILELSRNANVLMFGFQAIFLLAFAARLVSTYWLTRYEDPTYHVSDESKFSFFDFVRRTKYSNFAKFVFFKATMMFSAFISAPYFSLYMLRDLQFSYWQFTTLAATSTVMGFIAMQYWGRITDTFGNKKVMTVSSYAIGIVPMLWLFSGDFYYLTVVQLYAGFSWAGFNLAAENFIYDAVSPPKRARCVAYQAIINGGFVFAGAYLGSELQVITPESIMLSSWSVHFTSALPIVFFVSGALRLLTSYYWMHRFNEVRDVTAIRHRDLLLEITHLRPIAGATYSLITGGSKNVERDIE